MPYSEEAQRLLRDVARLALNHGVEHGRAPRISPSEYPPELADIRATFVTLNRDRKLRGCMGVLEAERPLVIDVAQNAFAAGFRDPRFPPLTAEELPTVELHISILSPCELIHYEGEEDLIRQLRPGSDGIILQEGFRKATFLPAVWQNLSHPGVFLKRLKEKAGLPESYWSDTLTFYRYTVESIH